MVRRRADAAGIATRIGNHTFRATGITAYLKNGGTLFHVGLPSSGLAGVHEGAVSSASQVRN
jgi:hypothetical protein